MDYEEIKKIIHENNERKRQEAKAIETDMQDKIKQISALRNEVSPNLTKRELFAAMAMQGMLANGVDRHDAHTNAIYAVQHADALINELNKE